MRSLARVVTVLFLLSSGTATVRAAEQAQGSSDEAVAAKTASAQVATGIEYVIGSDDILDISILQPEKLFVTVTVAPDGSISFPYIGSVKAKDLTLSALQQQIQSQLANGYMKYPVVSVALREARSRKFFVYGEVMRPGTFPLESNATVLRAITMAGGFTKFGSSHVKVLRPRKDKPGYDTVKVNIKAIMDGADKEDIILQPEDIVVVSQGVF